MIIVRYICSWLRRSERTGKQLCPERAQRPFPLNYPAAQADGAVKGVHGTGTAAFAVRIRSDLDGAGGGVLDTLILEIRYLGKRGAAAPARARFTAAAELRNRVKKQKTTWQ